ncbi:deoxyribonuclease-2-beta isoform X1 [Amblyraja radiata]|uniref:deoxyribonuclease-2-beta isoform X1 n=1 Tax=Amblyraja radiata TaxID=386614 RepID=UPI0014024986|nr:deoxyribonuclease-2-beta isoform X1 [Amblyraja radiata]
MKTGPPCSLLLLIVALLHPGLAAISCRNELGQQVDWFAVYKLPRHVEHRAGGLGLTYIYLDPSMKDWQKGKYLVNATESAVGRTLQQLYSTYTSKVNDSAYFIYNDAAPWMPYDPDHGHTKGVLMFDRVQGLWLMHSVPNFPPGVEQGYSWPNSGRRNGQSFLCVTIPYHQVTEIGDQLSYTNPQVYNWTLPHLFLPELSHLQIVAKGGSLARTPWIRRAKLMSTGGVLFQSFAKYKLFGDDIYAAWVAQSLGTDLLVQSWRRGKHVLPSNCSLPKHVYNVDMLELPGPALFDTRQDHSKWCVSPRPARGWFCIADLNRTPWQMWRSGGLLCTQSPSLYRAFRKLVSHYKNCS